MLQKDAQRSSIDLPGTTQYLLSGCHLSADPVAFCQWAHVQHGLDNVSLFTPAFSLAYHSPLEHFSAAFLSCSLLSHCLGRYEQA